LPQPGHLKSWIGMALKIPEAPGQFSPPARHPVLR
jgi:hypothetical protein